MPEGQRRRARRDTTGTRRRRPLRFPIDPDFVARAVDEGVLMTRTAVTMAAMNHIVVAALGRGSDYDPAEVAGFIDGELRALTLEQTAMAAHMRRLMVEFPPSFRKSTTISDHHLLVQRRVIYSALASELERLRADPEFVDAAVDASRRWAWSELGRAIEARLDGAVVAASGALADPDYAADRGNRMRTLVEVDLAGLAARTGRPDLFVKGLPTDGHPEQA